MLIDDVTRDIAGAMRRRDQAALAPLRMLKAALMNREVEVGRALSDEEALQVVRSLVKQRREAAEQFRAGGRAELADREQAEVTFLERLLPPAAGADAIARAIDEAIAETGAAGPGDMGRVMKAVMGRLAGLTVDGRAVSAAVRARLAGGS